MGTSRQEEFDEKALIDQEDPEVFRDKVQSVDKRIPVLCVNPDRVAMEGLPPRPVVRQGSVAQMFTEEQFPVYLIGKPSTIIYDIALQKFPQNIQKNKILMIGDTPETDIRGAHGAGLAAALVTKTGIMTAILEKEGIAQVIGHLPSSDKPEFLIERLNPGLFHQKFLDMRFSYEISDFHAA